MSVSLEMDIEIDQGGKTTSNIAMTVMMMLIIMVITVIEQNRKKLMWSEICSVKMLL